MKTIAFVCSGNSFKSIVCERFAKELTNDFIIVSAGTNPAEKVNEDGAKIMAGRGLSISNYRPHSLDELPESIDYLVEIGCDLKCPFVPARETFTFNMDEYQAKTFEEKKVVVSILEEKVKEVIKMISKDSK